MLQPIVVERKRNSAFYLLCRSGQHIENSCDTLKQSHLILKVWCFLFPLYNLYIQELGSANVMKAFHSILKMEDVIERELGDKILRYESSTLILYKELSSTIFQSCQSVSLSVRHR